MSELQLVISLEDVQDEVTYRIPTLDPSGIRRAVERWMQFGIWVQQPSGSYHWYAPREIRHVKTPAGTYPPGVFEPFSVQQQVKPSLPPQVFDSKKAVERMAAAAGMPSTTCPHCRMTMIPLTVQKGPNAGLPKCTNPECGRIIRPEAKKAENAAPIENA